MIYNKSCTEPEYKLEERSIFRVLEYVGWKYLTRDRDGTLRVWKDKPYKREKRGVWSHDPAIKEEHEFNAGLEAFEGLFKTVCFDGSIIDITKVNETPLNAKEYFLR